MGVDGCLLDGKCWTAWWSPLQFPAPTGTTVRCGAGITCFGPRRHRRRCGSGVTASSGRELAGAGRAGWKRFSSCARPDVSSLGSAGLLLGKSNAPQRISSSVSCEQGKPVKKRADGVKEVGFPLSAAVGTAAEQPPRRHTECIQLPVLQDVPSRPNRSGPNGPCPLDNRYSVGVAVVWQARNLLETKHKCKSN